LASSRLHRIAFFEITYETSAIGELTVGSRSAWREVRAA